MFVVGPHLFSGDELENYLAERKAEAVRSVRELEGVAIRSRGTEEILRDVYGTFRMPETQMHVEQAYFSDERPLTEEEREAIGVVEEDAHKFKAVTITIPYSGDAHLFTCTPTVYSAHQPQAEVKEGALHITYFLNAVEEFQLEQNFKRQIALIDRTLEVTQWQAMGYNQELMEALHQAMRERAATA